MNLTKEKLQNGTTICVSSEHRFGTDAMLLSHFCNIKRLEVACDLGTGCGIMPLRFYDGGHKGLCTAVDLCPDAIALLNASVEENGASNIVPICADLKGFTQNMVYDLVSCNPPYFTGGFKSENNTRRIARFEEACNSDDVCQTAARLLKDGGRLCICQRPERMADVMCAMRLAKIEPKVLRMVKQKSEQKPWLFLIEGQKNRKSGLRVLPDLIIEDENGNKSAELLKIYKEVR